MVNVIRSEHALLSQNTRDLKPSTMQTAASSDEGYDWLSTICIMTESETEADLWV